MTNEEMMKGLREKRNPLELSIQKWTDIVEGNGVNDGLGNCALCELYLDRGICCDGCVIFNHTNAISCVGTPYTRFTNHTYKCPDCFDEVGGYCESALELAKEEVAFLESLKEEEKKSEEVSS